MLPSLIALASFLPWTTGEPWPGPSLVVIGVALVGALGVDWQLQRTGHAPDWWLRRRLPLSIGLGGLSIAMATL